LSRHSTIAISLVLRTSWSVAWIRLYIADYYDILVALLKENVCQLGGVKFLPIRRLRRRFYLINAIYKIIQLIRSA